MSTWAEEEKSIQEILETLALVKGPEYMACVYAAVETVQVNWQIQRAIGDIDDDLRTLIAKRDGYVLSMLTAALGQDSKQIQAEADRILMRMKGIIERRNKQ